MTDAKSQGILENLFWLVPPIFNSHFDGIFFYDRRRPSVQSKPFLATSDRVAAIDQRCGRRSSIPTAVGVSVSRSIECSGKLQSCSAHRRVKKTTRVDDPILGRSGLNRIHLAKWVGLQLGLAHSVCFLFCLGVIQEGLRAWVSDFWIWASDNAGPCFNGFGLVQTE